MPNVIMVLTRGYLCHGVILGNLYHTHIPILGMSNQEETHPIDTFVLSWISKHLLDGKVPSTSVPIFQMTNQLDDDECCQKLQCDFEQEFNVKEADCINPEMTAQDIIEHFKQSVSL